MQNTTLEAQNTHLLAQPVNFIQQDDTGNTEHVYCRLPFKLSNLQKQLFKGLKLRNFIVCHRSSGKTFGGIMMISLLALLSPYEDGLYMFAAPNKQQAEDIAWPILQRILGHIPFVKFDNQNKSIQLPNGARILLVGLDKGQYEKALRGKRIDFIFFDEVALVPDLEVIVTEVLSGALRFAGSDRQGVAIFATTPPRPGECPFYHKMADLAVKEPDLWSFHKYDVYTAGVLSEAQIEQERKLSGELAFNREFLLLENYAGSQAYYSEAMRQAELDGRIGNYPYNPALGVYVSMDLGRDGSCIWFAQVSGGKVHLIDYFQALDNKLTTEDIINIIKNKPYTYNYIYLPHDSVRTDMNNQYSTYMKFTKAFKCPISKDTKDPVKSEAILRTRAMIGLCCFDAKTHEGIRALRLYSPKIDKMTGRPSQTPKHDEWSHGADAFSYLFVHLKLNGNHMPKYTPEWEKYRTTNSNMDDWSFI